MPKYAMLWTTNLSYMPGTNGILNALEFYGFSKDIDKHILVWEDDGFSNRSSYWDNWPDVKTSDIDQSFWDYPKDAYWYMVFSDIHYAIGLLEEYDVVLLWGADVCPLDNFEGMFKVCHKLDMMILGHNEQGNQTFNAMSKEKPYGHTWDVPYADIPFFIPKSQKKVLETVLDIQKDAGNKTDRMDGLNYSIRDLSAPVFTVPGMLWVMNVTGKLKTWDNGNGMIYVWNQRMQSFHRKYWSPAFCKSYMTPHNEVVKHNHIVFNRLWNLFNKSGRVKWDRGVELWDGN